MKIAKIYAIMAVAGVGLMLASCSDVTEPKFQKPTSNDFKLLTPPLQDQYFELTPTGTFDMVVNGQPDYGFSAITQYRVDVSLTENFVEDDDATPNLNEGNYRTLTPTGTGTHSRMTLKMEDLAVAMNELAGVTSEEDYTDRGIEKVYFRGRAFISGIEESVVVTSNVVVLNNVQCYFALRLPAYIYCIGDYLKDWIAPEAGNAEKLIPYRISEKEDGIGSNMFYGSVDFQDNEPVFRFYTGLNGWTKPADFDGTGKTGPDAFFSLGAVGGNDDDNPVEFEDFVAGSTLTHALMETKDSFKFPNYRGIVVMEVDLTDTENPTATFTTAE